MYHMYASGIGQGKSLAFEKKLLAKKKMRDIKSLRVGASKWRRLPRCNTQIILSRNYPDNPGAPGFRFAQHETRLHYHHPKGGNTKSEYRNTKQIRITKYK